MTTSTKANTLQAEMDAARPGRLDDMFRKVKIGTMLSPIKVVVAALAAAPAVDITAAATKAAATITGKGLESGENLPAIGQVVGLRVTTSGTANSVGSYAVADDGATPISPTAGANVGLATLSDDGKTLTFPTSVTGFVLTYYPRSAASMTSEVSSITT